MPHPSLGFLMSHALNVCASTPVVNGLCRWPPCQAAGTSHGTAGPACLRCCYALAAALQNMNRCPFLCFLPALGTGVHSHVDQSDGKIRCPVFSFTSLLTGEGTIFFAVHASFTNDLCPLPLGVLSLCDVDSYPFSSGFSGS